MHRKAGAFSIRFVTFTSTLVYSVFWNQSMVSHCNFLKRRTPPIIMVFHLMYLSKMNPKWLPVCELLRLLCPNAVYEISFPPCGLKPSSFIQLAIIFIT